MRTITVQAPDWSKVEGVRCVVPVLVDWTELRLTEEQVIENAIAAANGKNPPHLDPRYIDIVLVRP